MIDSTVRAVESQERHFFLQDWRWERERENSAYKAIRGRNGRRAGSVDAGQGKGRRLRDTGLSVNSQQTRNGLSGSPASLSSPLSLRLRDISSDVAGHESH